MMKKKNLKTILLTSLIVAVLTLSTSDIGKGLENKIEVTAKTVYNVTETIEVLEDNPTDNHINNHLYKVPDVIRGEILDNRIELRDNVRSIEEILEELKRTFSEDEIVDYFGEDLEWLESKLCYEIITVHRIRILEVFQGNHNIGDIVEIIQPVELLENKNVINENLIYFETSDDFDSSLLLVSTLEG